MAEPTGELILYRTEDGRNQIQVWKLARAEGRLYALDEIETAAEDLGRTDG